MTIMANQRSKNSKKKQPAHKPSDLSLAVIETGGKQYLVKEGDKLIIEKVPVKEGGEVVFENVLLQTQDGRVKIGKPYVKNARVKAKHLRVAKAKKVLGMKYKPKKRYRVKFGHRQLESTVEVTKIEAN